MVPVLRHQSRWEPWQKGTQDSWDPLSFVCAYPVDELRASAPAGWPALLLLSRPCCLDAKEGQSYKMMRERETSLTKAAAETSIIPWPYQKHNRKKNSKILPGSISLVTTIDNLQFENKDNVILRQMKPQNVSTEKEDEDLPTNSALSYCYYPSAF
jgi:hypothetical protein